MSCKYGKCYKHCKDCIVTREEIEKQKQKYNKNCVFGYCKIRCDSCKDYEERNTKNLIKGIKEIAKGLIKKLVS